MLTVAGIGCRRHCPATDIIAAVRAAERAANCTVDALAAPTFKHAEPGVQEAAAILGLPLHLINDAHLAQMQPLCPTRSATAQRATGHASIAEAAALAPGGTLLLPRLTHGSATCAIATLPPLPPAGEGRGEGLGRKNGPVR